MSDYIRVTIATPEAHTADANQLARVLGYGPDDDKTFGAAFYTDASSNRYAVASGLVKPVFAEDAFAELVEPEWGADMEAAAAAQMILQTSTLDAEDPLLADPDHITAIIGDDPQAAIALMGLTRSYPEE